MVESFLEETHNQFEGQLPTSVFALQVPTTVDDRPTIENIIPAWAGLCYPCNLLAKSTPKSTVKKHNSWVCQNLFLKSIGVYQFQKF